MALYVNSTPIRKLQKDNTTLHSLKVNNTEVFNDLITNIFEIGQIGHETEESESWGVRHGVYNNVYVKVSSSRADGLPSLSSVSVRVRVYRFNLPADFIDRNKISDHTYNSSELRSGIEFTEATFWAINTVRHDPHGVRLDFSTGLTVYFFLQPEGSYYSPYYSFNSFDNKIPIITGVGYKTIYSKNETYYENN